MNPHALRPAPPPPAPPLEHHAWTVAKRGHLTTCHARTTPGGPELVIRVAGDLWWSHVYQGATTEILTAEADRKRAEFLAKGWAVAMPRAVE